MLLVALGSACAASTESQRPTPTVNALELGLTPAPSPTIFPTAVPEATGLPVETATAAPAVSSACKRSGRTPEPGVITLNAVGDLMLARDIVTLMNRYGSLYPFEAICSQLAEADITIANLEGTLTERGLAAEKFYTFRTPPRHAIGLAEAGIDVVSLGNNHTMDFGPEGLEDTLAALDAVGIARSGAGLDDDEAREPAILELNGLQIAFLSYNAVLEATFADASNPGVAAASTDGISQGVSDALSRADIVVVSVHAGIEYTDTPTEEQRALAHAAIDAGALLVLGTHPHVLQGWERYNGGLIVFSLGNFVFDLDSEDLETLGPRPFQTIILQVELSRLGVHGVMATPVYIDSTQNRPLPPDSMQVTAIKQRLAVLNAGFD